MRRLWFKLRGLFRRKLLRQEIDEEMRLHLELRTAQNVADGMTPEEAARAARKRFGNVQNVRTDCREASGAGFGETVCQDIRFALRILRNNPGFTTVVVLTLALGIGANTAIFSVINAVLLRPLPYRDPGRILMIWAAKPALGLGLNELPAEALDLPEWRSQAGSFEHIAAFRPWPADLSERGDPERLAGSQATANLFQLLGMQPLFGRTFSAEEEQPGKDKVTILSHDLWLRRFSGDTNLVGQPITLNGERRTVVGIMPPGFGFPRGAELPAAYQLLPQTEIWLPFAERPDWWSHDENHVRRGFFIIGRIRPGISLGRAQAEMNVIAARQEKEHPLSHSGWTVHLQPLALQLGSGMRTALLLLLGVVVLVLLIACVNVANLFLCRSASRRGEMAIRAAMGAGPGRIVRQLLTESLVLSALGGVLGLVVGWCGLQFLIRLTPPGLGSLSETTLDSSVLIFTALVTLATGVLFGAAPAWQAARINLTEAFNADGRSSSAARRIRAHGSLVTMEVALAVLLLSGAGLMIKSFLRLQAVDPGFDSRQLAVFGLTLSGNSYSDQARGRAFFRGARERLAALPGVRNVAAVSSLPLSGIMSAHAEGLIIEGRPLPLPGAKTPAQAQSITPGYFATMGIPLLLGRDFNDQDTAERPIVCIINETIARSFFAGLNPLGKRLRLGDGTPDEANNPFYTIVGVARDVHGLGLDVKPQPEVYLPLEQADYQRAMTFVVRPEATEAASLERNIRAEMKALDPALPVAGYRTMAGLVSNALSRQRFSAFLFGLFAATALLLTVVGIYGVVAYTAAQRTREIGIRVALGAQSRSILALLIRQGMLPALAGLALGVVGALGSTRFLAGLLYEVGPGDPTNFVFVVSFLLLATFVACWLPARRGARIPPMTALRAE